MIRKIVTLSLLLVTTGCSVIGIRTEEEAPYKTLVRDGAFEVRQYSDFVSAETTVDRENWDEASRVAFRRLAGYIFGKNERKQKIPMTAPVLMSPDARERGAREPKKIDMTAPVLAKRTTDGWKMSFVLPAEITFDSAPDPIDEKIILREQKGKKLVAVRFSGFLGDKKLTIYTEKLKSWAQENELEIVSDPVLAGYDPPWTIPFLRRNEVLMEIH